MAITTNGLQLARIAGAAFNQQLSASDYSEILAANKTAAELKTMINRIIDAEENGKDCHASVILDSLKDAYVVLTGEAYNAGK